MDGGGDRARYTTGRIPGLAGAGSAHGPPPGLPYPNQTNPFQQPLSFDTGSNGYPFYSQHPSANLLVNPNSGSPMSFHMNPVLAQQQHQSISQHGPFFESARKTSLDNSSYFEQHDPSSARIKPLIENLVGSMGGHNGGTYSHFGPSPSTVLGGFGLQQSQQPLLVDPPASFNNNSAPMPDPFNSTTLEGQFQQKMEHKIRQKQLLQLQQEGGFGTPLILSGVIGSGKQSPNHVSLESNHNHVPRPATPTNTERTKEPVIESNSRPETPGVSLQSLNSYLFPSSSLLSYIF